MCAQGLKIHQGRHCIARRVCREADTGGGHVDGGGKERADAHDGDLDLSAAATELNTSTADAMDAIVRDLERPKTSFGTPELKRQDLCLETIKEECQRRSKSKSVKDMLDHLKILLNAPASQGGGDFWISKQWCKDKLNGTLKEEQDPNGDQVFCSCHGSSCGAGSGNGGQARSSSRCADGLNQDRAMTPDKSKRRLVSVETISFLQAKEWEERGGRRFRFVFRQTKSRAKNASRIKKIKHSRRC